MEIKYYQDAENRWHWTLVWGTKAESGAPRIGARSRPEGYFSKQAAKASILSTRNGLTKYLKTLGYSA